ncbi:MAG: hypothetical protein ACLRRT_02100 [Ruthenibacterium lactatiformans]
MLMKSGRQLPGVLAALERRGSLERSALVSNCGCPENRFMPTFPCSRANRTRAILQRSS